jgi:hypothetical protein
LAGTIICCWEIFLPRLLTSFAAVPLFERIAIQDGVWRFHRARATGRYEIKEKEVEPPKAMSFVLYRFRLKLAFGAEDWPSDLTASAITQNTGYRDLGVVVQDRPRHPAKKGKGANVPVAERYSP